MAWRLKLYDARRTGPLLTYNCDTLDDLLEAIAVSQSALTEGRSLCLVVPQWASDEEIERLGTLGSVRMETPEAYPYGQRYGDYLLPDGSAVPRDSRVLLFHARSANDAGSAPSAGQMPRAQQDEDASGG